jgi:hypothetical protein
MKGEGSHEVEAEQHTRYSVLNDKMKVSEQSRSETVEHKTAKSEVRFEVEVAVMAREAIKRSRWVRCDAGCGGYELSVNQTGFYVLDLFTRKQGRTRTRRWRRLCAR